MEGGAIGPIAKDAAVDHKRIIKVLLEDILTHKGVAVVRAARLILAQLVEGYAAKIVKGCCRSSIFCLILYVHFGFES